MAGVTNPDKKAGTADKQKPAQASRNDPLKTRLARLGLTRQTDFLLHLPLRYEDETRISPIATLNGEGSAQIEGEITACEILPRPRRQLVAQLDDGSGRVTLRFLHFYPSHCKMLAAGKRVRAFGELRQGFAGLEMVHPHISSPLADLPQNLTPVYPTTAGLSQAALRKLIAHALQETALPETLPEDWRHRAGNIPALMKALAFLHHPPPEADQNALLDRAHPAWRRVKLDELIAQQISLRLAYQARRAIGAPTLAGNAGGDSKDSLANALIAGLPFPLTAAQRRVSAEILADMATPYPMQRLLQGDVGAGKTLVAALAVCRAIESGFQAAFMAPTEILAEQHFLKFSDWLSPLGVRVAWLSGKQKTRDKNRELQAAQSAELVIGTHALIQDNVVFSRLGLIIIDEQHRFGVHQRLALRQKGETPHQLMMSATPIPRTLAMSYCADLDVSTLDELPPGRSPIRTRLASMERREEIMAWLARQLAEGRQAYWVCPLIEESETLELQTARETCAWLSEAMPEHAVGLVHGRLKAAEKQSVMGAFSAGAIKLLVATTVIEVGVDIPNASVMIIEHAERFGLAQLHQLRGRVGRGSAESVCVLIYAHPLSLAARERLKILFESTDGFEIARRDLQLRGPGEFIGSRQSGTPLLRYADLELDAPLLELAREIAPMLIENYPEQADQHRKLWLERKEETIKT